MRLRKPFITRFLLALSAVLALMSCADEFAEGIVGNNAGDDDNSECYLCFQVLANSDGSQTRAGSTYEDWESDQAGSGDFVHGNEELEQKIDLRSSFMILFNSDSTLFAEKPIRQLMDKALLEKDGYVPLPGDNGYIEAGYVTKIYPNLKAKTKEEKWPRQCLLVLNAPNMYEKLTKMQGENPNLKLKDIVDIVWDGDTKNPEKIGRTDAGYFTMTNAVYVSGDKVHVAAQIEDKHIDLAKRFAEKRDDAEVIITTDPPEKYKERGDKVFLINPNDLLRIRVERMVAKCTFEFSEETSKRKKEGEETVFEPDGSTPLVFFEGFADGGISFVSVRDWRVRVTGWGINALETKDYLFKNINEKGNYLADVTANMNDSSSYRSYWAEDPHYDYNERNDESTDPLLYPWQYRKAVDRPDVYYLEDCLNGTCGENENHLFLKNYSYYDFKFENHESLNEKYNVDKFDFSKTVYVPENTYDKDVVAGDKLLADTLLHDSRDELLAGTHLIVGAELEVWEDSERKFRIYDLYRDRNGIYYESQRHCFVSLVHSFNQSLTSQSVMEFTLYDWDGNEGGGRVTDKNGQKIGDKDTLVANTGGEFMLCYKEPLADGFKVLDDNALGEIMAMDSITFDDTYGSLASATLRGGDGKRLPWLNDAIEHGRLAIKKVKKKDNGWVVENAKLPICRKAVAKSGATIAGEQLWDDADDDDVKSMLYEWLGAVAHFNNGKMYYSKGIDNTPHIEHEPDKYYGVVRNSWYKFVLKNIQSIGVPVDDPAQPIVPDVVSNNDQINVSVKILEWHEVEGNPSIFLW